ncbi:FeoA family protein [Diaphorobacter aerolatus]|uniref:Ferrous iron transport protein A n=1 Tax=Diaphorobacter aerolatus TaxID=1288495 RepID=A0A7H0GMU4_9BURK|nr:FeoA family protein [Diaphorobacter aerolatus]QNP49610.1 ferrous iron transport protein A [Diaphorobacter aerolatus]
MRVQPQDSSGQTPRGVAQVAAGIALDTLERHRDGVVVGLRPANGELEKSLVLRLMEIGFLPGEQVRVLATGFPGADPLAIRVGQATFALRRDEAAFVLVQPARA